MRRDTDQTIYNMGYCLNIELSDTFFNVQKITYSSFNQKQWSIFILSDTTAACELQVSLTSLTHIQVKRTTTTWQ